MLFINGIRSLSVISARAVAGMRADGRVQYLFGGVARQEQPDTAAQAQAVSAPLHSFRR